MAAEREQVRVVDFYTEVVLPALAERLDQAFPEFGWRRDARGWVATNEEHTHAQARRPRGTRRRTRPRAAWLPRPRRRADAVDGVPRGGRARRAVRSSSGSSPNSPTVPASIRTYRARDAARPHALSCSRTFFRLAQPRARSATAADAARAYLEQRRLPCRRDRALRPRRRSDRSSSAMRELLARAATPTTRSKRADFSRTARWPGRSVRRLAERVGRGSARSGRGPSIDAAAGRDCATCTCAALADEPPAVRSRSGALATLVLVEGFFDYHQLARSRGREQSPALGGTSTNPHLFEQLSRRGVQTLVLCLDNDDAGRAATSRAVENSTRARISPAVYVISPEHLGPRRTQMVSSAQAASRRGIHCSKSGSAASRGAQQISSPMSPAMQRCRTGVRRSPAQARGSARSRLGSASSRRTLCAQSRTGAAIAQRQFDGRSSAVLSRRDGGWGRLARAESAPTQNGEHG